MVRLDGTIDEVPFVETEEDLFLIKHLPSDPAMAIPTTPALEPEEQQLLADFEAGELSSLARPALLSQLQEAAKATGLKDQRINIRLSGGDLQAI